MSLVVFTGLCGCWRRRSDPSVLGFTAILCIALGAGAAAALNMWYEADLDALMKRTKGPPLPAGRMDGVGAPLRSGPRLLLGRADGRRDELVRRRVLAVSILFYVSSTPSG
jgi:protoheme IX farnesyltransferase